MKRKIILLSLLFVFFVINTAGIYALLTSQRTLQVWDFQPLWQAGRWILQGRGDPYSEEMTLLLQRKSYGRLAEEGEDPRAFVYPLYALLLVLPFSFLPLPLAQAAWFTVLEFAVILSVVGTVRLVGWRMPALKTLFVVVGGLLLYPIAWALALGQVSIPILALFVLVLLALQNHREGWAGACLALTTCKPQMSFLLVPALLLWGLVQHRYRFLTSFVATMALFVLISFAILPGWMGSILDAGSGYFAVQPFSPPVALLGDAIGGKVGHAATALLVILLLAGLAWTWWEERDSPSLPLRPSGLTLVITALIAPRTSIVNQTSLIIPLFLSFAELARRGRRGRRVASALAILLVGGFWAIDRLWFPPMMTDAHWRAQHRLFSPILPTLLLLGLGTWILWAQTEGQGS